MTRRRAGLLRISSLKAFPRREAADLIDSRAGLFSGSLRGWPWAPRCQRARPPPSGLSSRGQEQVKLVYQDWRTDWFPPMAQKALEEFHATHPGIRVFYTPDPDKVEDKMLADMQAGTAADVFQGCCTHFPIWAQKGYTVDLRPYVAADLDRTTIEDWDPAQYNSFFTREGRQYGLPKYHGALALYYNKDLLDKYHVDYPDGSWDHDDYLTAMMRLVPAGAGRPR